MVEIRIFLGFLVLAVAFAVTFVAFRVGIPRLRRAGIVGRDMHKPDRPEVPEMGGLFLVIGFCAGMVTIIGLNTFLDRFLSIDLVEVIAVLSVVLIAALIGVIDDVIGVRQIVKAITPLFIALPLVAIEAGVTTMNVPVIGGLDLGIVYVVVLVPLGVAGAANAVNMLAGFNGQEVGVGMVAVGSLAVVAYMIGETAALLILLAALGALLATLYYNWYPARVFIGDAGTLSIGAIIASAVIVGNFEVAGLIIMIPYFVDFLIKAKNRFPSSSYQGSWATCNGDKLYCPETGPVGLGLLIVKIAGGTGERNVALILMGFETICGAVAIWLYL